jgi:hypothetical protein
MMNSVHLNILSVCFGEHKDAFLLNDLQVAFFFGGRS